MTSKRRAPSEQTKFEANIQFCQRPYDIQEAKPAPIFNTMNSADGNSPNFPRELTLKEPKEEPMWLPGEIDTSEQKPSLDDSKNYYMEDTLSNSYNFGTSSNAHSSKPVDSNEWDQYVKQEEIDHPTTFENNYNHSPNATNFLKSPKREEISYCFKQESYEFALESNSQMTIRNDDHLFEYKPLREYSQPNSISALDMEDLKCEPYQQNYQQTSSTSVRSWKPNIRSLNAFLNNDDDSDVDDLLLGNSILFNNRSKRQKLNKKDSEDVLDDEFEGNTSENKKKAQSASFVKRAINDFFVKNPHPTPHDLLEMSDSLNIRYRNLYDTMEKKRKAAKIECADGDPCKRIAIFYEREFETNFGKLDRDTRVMLYDQIETHLLSRKRFTIGYIHMIMEKTNLAPAYIRSQYDALKKKFLTKDRDYHRLGIELEDNQATLSIEILRSLENAYLCKKYQCEQQQWTLEEIQNLALKLNVSEKTVTQWIEKRKSTRLGLDDDIIQLRRDNDRKKKNRSYEKLPSWKVAELEEAFANDQDMSSDDRRELAAKLDLDLKKVTAFFKRQRFMVKKKNAKANHLYGVVPPQSRN